MINELSKDVLQNGNTDTITEKPKDSSPPSHIPTNVATTTDLSNQTVKLNTELPNPDESQPQPINKTTESNNESTIDKPDDEYTRWILTASQKKIQRKARRALNKEESAIIVNLNNNNISNNSNNMDLPLQSSNSDNDNSKDSQQQQLPIQPSVSEKNETLSKQLKEKDLQLFDPLSDKNDNSNSNNNNTTMDLSTKENIVITTTTTQSTRRRRHKSLGPLGSFSLLNNSEHKSLPATRLPTPKSSTLHLNSSAMLRTTSGSTMTNNNDAPLKRRTRTISTIESNKSSLYTHLLDLDDINNSNNNNNNNSTTSSALPIVPRKCDTKLPISSSTLSSITKPSSKRSLSSFGHDQQQKSLGKANKQLMDFDPFLSQDLLEKKKDREDGNTE
ncbi:hypothetical protein BJ944DRAFT_244235, partial [Cunninghamella echinulata]